MNDIALHVDQVWKKFRKGEINDGLRDTLRTLALLTFGSRSTDARLGDREFWALEDVSFQVKRGGSLGIIGPNGAGKSTMLKLLSRILKPNRGSFVINGRVTSLIEIGAGFHQDLTGRENIFLNATIHGMSRKQIRVREGQIIEFAEIEEFIDTPVKRYSSGMKARLGFAIAAHLDPDILLVDEVLSVGDVKFRQKCLAHMERLLDSNVTLVFISHILDQVRRLCPETLVLDRGRVIFEGPTEEATSVYLDTLRKSTGDADDAGHDADAWVRHIRFCDETGAEVDKWIVHQPAVIQCELVINRHVERPNVVLKFFDVRGLYLGTTGTSRSDLELSSEPGVYRLRFTLDPMPFVDGDYAVQFLVYDQARPLEQRCLWQIGQAHMISVRGGDIGGALLHCDGRWQFADADRLVSQATK